MTPNFTLEELTFSQTAKRMGIRNVPSQLALENLKETATRLEEVRKLLNVPINISSGYRSPTLNRSIGGSATSHHTLGFAVDFTARRFGSVSEIVEKIKNSDIQYDQLIDEFSDNGGGWVHLSFHPNMRRQTLKASKINRKTVYKHI